MTRSGPYALGALALAAAASIAATPAFGQADAVERCRAMTSDAERIACLEEALLSESAAPSPAPEAAPAPAVSPDEPPARRGWLRAPRIPFIGGDDGADQPRAADSEGPGERVASSSPAAEEFGAEQIENRGGVLGMRDNDETPRMFATIVSFEEVHRDRVEVVLDNGQVWRQTQADRQPIRLREGDDLRVELWRSGFGGYRLSFPDKNRTIRVERVR